MEKGGLFVGKKYLRLMVFLSGKGDFFPLFCFGGHEDFVKW